MSGLEVIQSGLPTFVEKGNPSAEDLRLAREGFALAQQGDPEARYQMVVLDEINVAVDYGLVPLDEVLELVRRLPGAASSWS